MRKIIKIAVFFSFCLSFSISFEGGAHDKCHEHFQEDSDSAQYSFSKSTKWTNPYAEELFSSVHQQLPLLRGQGWSQEEIQFFVPRVERLLHHIENSSDPIVQNRLALLNPYLSAAVQAVPDILSFVKNGKAKEYESLDAKGIIKLTLSTLTHHTMAYLRHPRAADLDWGRMRVILESIAQFKVKPTAFSLYKIQVVVREKFDLAEYVNCY